MRRLICAAMLLCMLAASPAYAVTDAPNPGMPSHVVAVLSEYHDLRRQVRDDTAWSPGEDLTHSGASLQRIEQSMSVLRNEISNPEPATAIGSSSGVLSPSAATDSVDPALLACVIRHESGGDPTQVTGQYRGLGQWDSIAWAQDGGLQYGSDPTQVSYANQLKVLTGEGNAGLRQQQAQFDGC